MKWLKTLVRHYRRRWICWTVVMVGFLICFWPMRRYTVGNKWDLVDRSWVLPEKTFEADPEVRIYFDVDRLRWEEDARVRFAGTVKNRSSWKQLDGVGEQGMLMETTWGSTLVFRRHNLVIQMGFNHPGRRPLDLTHDLIAVARTADNRIRNYEGTSWSIDTLANKLWLQEYKVRTRNVRHKWRDLLF